MESFCSMGKSSISKSNNRKGFFESMFADKTFHFQHEMKQYGLMLQIVRTEEVVDLLISGNSFMKMLQVTEQRKMEEKREKRRENQLAASALFQSVVASAPSNTKQLT